MNNRRSFLHGLTTLPLIGGGVTLIGMPEAVAEPTTADLCETYKTWLDNERRWLSWEMAGDPRLGGRWHRDGSPTDRVALSKHIDSIYVYRHLRGATHGDDGDRPSSRAALVLSAVGCDWRGSEEFV